MGCGDPNETVTVAPFTPALDHQRHSGFGSGRTPRSPTSPRSAAATAPPARSPGSSTAPTTPAARARPRPPAPSRSAATAPTPSPPLTPTVAGTYHWVASYSGDTNNTADPQRRLHRPQRDAQRGHTSRAELHPGQAAVAHQLRLHARARSPRRSGRRSTTRSSSPTPATRRCRWRSSTRCASPSAVRRATSSAVSCRSAAPRRTPADHVVVAADFPTYVNVAQVTATPPGGSPLPPQRSSVLANVPKQAVAGLHDVEDQAHADRQEAQDGPQVEQRQDGHHDQRDHHRDPQRRQSRHRHQARSCSPSTAVR